MDPRNSDYSRPAPGDYDGDGWMDIAIACSDGYWRIDFGGPDRTDYGTFDDNYSYLSADQLALAPGWAYLTQAGQYIASGFWDIAYKVPDTLPEEGRLIIYRATDPTHIDLAELNEIPHFFGGNHYVPLVHSGGNEMVSLKNSGTWNMATWHTDGSITLEPTPPQGKEIWGLFECKPIVADFDGDTVDDRAVMCPNEWRIAYTGYAGYGSLDTPFPMDADGIRRVSLGYNTSKFSLPGRSYSGGINYSFVQQLIAYAQETNPTQPPPIPVDMASVNVCSLPVEGSAGECH
jgi:hypothetical protein